VDKPLLHLSAPLDYTNIPQISWFNQCIYSVSPVCSYAKSIAQWWMQGALAMDEKELRELFGRNIKRYRKIKGFSQAALAEKLDFSTNHVSDIETGKYWVSSELLAKLADSLGVKVSEFFAEEISRDARDKINKYLDEVSESLKNSCEKSITDAIQKIRDDI
jgi:transcriptional regulator with XRE-family HTH domain